MDACASVSTALMTESYSKKQALFPDEFKETWVSDPRPDGQMAEYIMMAFDITINYKGVHSGDARMGYYFNRSRITKFIIRPRQQFSTDFQNSTRPSTC